MTTLIITGQDIRQLMTSNGYLVAVEDAFRASATGRANAPYPMHIAIPRGGLHAKGARLALGRDYVAIKINANCPDNPAELGLPTIQGGLMLFDGQDGRLLAIMDSIEVTLRRTAAASALAARYLARENANTLLICGCGEQGLAHVEAMRAVRTIERLLLWDRDPGRAIGLASKVGGEVVEDLTAAALDSRIIVTCTSATEPFLDSAMVADGTFIAAVGADSPAKSEITPSLMARAKVVADIRSQCAEMGDLYHAIAAGLMTSDDLYGDLAELLTAKIEPRTSDDQVFLLDSTGTGLQDVAAAAAIYERAAGTAVGLQVELA